MPKKQVKKPVKKAENLEETLQQKYGKGIAYASEKEERFKNISWVDTGSYILNKLINYQGRGIPAANMVEIFGGSTSGKSVTGLHVVRSTQEQDGIVIYYDSEDSLDPPLARNTGIDLKKLLIVSPATIGEKRKLYQLTVKDVMSRTEHIIRTVRKQYGPEKLLSFVWDSLGGTCWEEDLDPNGPKLTQGLPERRLKRWITRIRPLVNSTNTLFFIVNQTFGQVGMYKKDASAGGKSKEFHSEIRIKCILEDNNKGKVLDKNGLPIGARLHYEIVKNRVGPPWGKGFAEFLFDRDGKPALDYYSGYANYLVEREAIEKGKGKLIVGEDSYQSKTEEGGFIRCKYMGKMLKEHPELLGV